MSSTNKLSKHKRRIDALAVDMIRSLLDSTSPLTLWLIGRQNMPENACVAKKISRASGVDVREVWERVQIAMKDKLEKSLRVE